MIFRNVTLLSMGTKKPSRRKRYHNQAFLDALGVHCKKVRILKGYSIDRLSKEGVQLSPATIHRLEQGQSDVQVSVLLRVAAVLEIEVAALLDFPFRLPSE